VVLLISTYDLGRQPFGLASAAAALKGAGHEVVCADLAKQKVDPADVGRASAIAFFLPMHTATRLAIAVIDRVRTLNPSAHLVAYGLYAPLNAPLLRDHGVRTILGGEFEDDLIRAVDSAASTDLATSSDGARPAIARVTFRVPDRTGLPALARYATLQAGDERRLAGYTEASRGCKHRCRHCPIVPVYDGRFRIVPVAIVMDDVAAQVAAGARHVTFGDPDFFNGIGHAKAIVDRFAQRFPGISYDVTIKVEHLLRHDDMLPRLRDTGCAFVTSAVESVDDRVLAALEKGHTRADVERVAARFREIGLVLAPTFVAFTPWTTLDGYRDLLETIERLDLVEQVAPIQLAIRLLVTEGSRLRELDDVRRLLRPFDPRSLTYPWGHPDPRVDRLQKTIESMVGVTISASRRDVFARVWRIAHEAAGVEFERLRLPPPRAARATIPYLNEPWYC
jgi:radical SAM superfamily enzyme YgiQ (UPF0313 family)